MLTRSPKSQQKVLNIAGSSTFGRYPKISSEKTVNMFMSDDFLVDYTGYIKAYEKKIGGDDQTGKGRGLYVSNILNEMIAVVGSGVYTITISYNQQRQIFTTPNINKVGTLGSTTGKVYITSNNQPQIVISDLRNLYVYDPTNHAVGGATFYLATNDGTAPDATNPLGFNPGFLDFHDSYVVVAATADTGSGVTVNNSWRLSEINNTTLRIYFPYDAQHVGYLQTKPDTTQAVVRFPSRGNVILIMGENVAEPWMDVGYQLFPYQRSTSSNFDYGCLNAATVASNDNIVAWLGQNENTGPIVVYSDGGNPEKITTDGIDYFLSQMENPADSEAFMYRQDGHLFYHINFYTDNVSLFYDFNTKKFFHACDENGNYFIASSVVFYNNQYYFLSKDDAYLYAMDSEYTTYDGKEIPRTRVCKPVRLPTQEYFSATDAGFTIEQGTTNPQQQLLGYPNIITQDDRQLITQGSSIFLYTQDGFPIETQDDFPLIAQQSDPTDFYYLIMNNQAVLVTYPRVDLSISIDGGYSFSSWMPYDMNPLGKAKNKIQWWQLGAANDMTCQFRFSGLGRFVATDGFLNIRQ